MIIEKARPAKWALLGCGAYVAPRHLKAIAATGGELIAAMDPYDSVGILDSYFRECKYFTNFERFDRYLDRLRRNGEGPDWLAVCTPNWLHDAHIRYGLKNGMDVLCEKPLVISPWNLDGLPALEDETGKRVSTVLQLRMHPAVQRLQASLDPARFYEIDLRYVTGRGPWYQYSWKNALGKSGGIAANIGIHFLDMLTWLFGQAHTVRVLERSQERIRGFLGLERAQVSFFLSTSFDDLPASHQEIRGVMPAPVAHRSMKLDGEEVDFSGGFTDLHTLVYEAALAREAPGVEEARTGIELAWKLMHQEVEPQAAERL